ncbi:MAG: dTDP-4-dehydrorhamnose reductase [Pararhodobacter sp.]
MILVFGEGGQLARALRRSAEAGGLSLLALGRARADLADPVACARTIRHHRPAAIINAAAYTAVDRAESEPELARRINAEAPGAMARAAADLGIPMVQVSTDYVFDGSGDAPFAPNHPPAPLNAYGHSKLEGEEAVREAGGPHAVLRTSWVFSAQGANFVKTMLRLGGERARLNVVADQFGGPTPAQALADACLTIAQALQQRPELSGRYHFSGFPDVSWAGFAREIMHQAELSCEIFDISTADFPTTARRPANSRLDCSATLQAFGLARPDWRAGLVGVLAEMKGTPA